MALDEQIVNTRKEIEDLDRRITEVENLVLETENFRKRQFLISASCVLIILLILLSFAISMAGYFIGAVIAIVLGSKNVKLKYLFGLGFLLIGLSALFMYFEVQTAGLYERMKYPVIIRATGMMLLYSLTAVLANRRMPYKYLSTWICVMLTVRMVLGPAVGTALYTNVMQQRQQHYVTRFAQDVDLLNDAAAASYTQTLRGMQYQGKSEAEAHNMAALSAKGQVQVQATLVSVKEMAGWTFYACLACMIFVLVIPYPKRKIAKLATVNEMTD